MKSNHYRCRNCDNPCHRHGKIKNKQRWKCSNCGLTQFRVYRRCTFTADRKTIIKRLNRENVGIRGMARLMGLSPTHIVRCILGSVTAAQTTLYALEHKEELGLTDTEISLTLSSKMLDQDSELFQALQEKAESDPNFQLLLQDIPADNVDGVAGKSKVGAIARGVRLALFPNKEGGIKQKGMLMGIKGRGKRSGHALTVMGESTAKTYKLVKQLLEANKLEGDQAAKDTKAILKEKESSGELETETEFPVKESNTPTNIEQ